MRIRNKLYAAATVALGAAHLIIHFTIPLADLALHAALALTFIGSFRNVST